MKMCSLTAIGRDIGRAIPGDYFTLLNPHPTEAPEQCVRLQAFASDWGAGTIAGLPPLPREAKEQYALKISRRPRHRIVDDWREAVLLTLATVRQQMMHGNRKATR